MNVRNHPEEWAKWMGKSGKGARNHEDPPFVQDPVELGTAVVRWWKMIQPSFRENPTGVMPAQIYTAGGTAKEEWAAVCKSGPNGLLSVMMLLLWWGRTVANRPAPYHEDLHEMWKMLIDDVPCCFVQFALIPPSLPERGTKRAADNDAPVVNKKARR
ncbi:hypothetical protein FA15DRAFT_709605 [Coprinopsis marcescibilis]|uniref:Uncharacterized protein n=1 Tax=Coprinopsis marcescibilis TaxID=230819 RepID=A0A5C3KFT6_COPMA|nr:hypothetical protein FA15DRAFT_709605 [Coprinopsis marcescibilis]